MRLEKEFRAPKGINAFKTVVVRELDGNDEVQIAVWCDGKRGQPGLREIWRNALCICPKDDVLPYPD